MPERGVMQHLLAAAMPASEHSASPAARYRLVSLHGQTQPTRLGPRGQDTHPRHAEHHRRPRAALTTVHVVEAFVISLLGRG